MYISALETWRAGLNVPRLMAQESAVLVILAASLLVFRTFRERYLFTWILAWLAYLISDTTLQNSYLPSAPHYLLAISQAEFILAVCLFAAAVFIYVNARKLLMPLWVSAVVLITYAVARALWWPDSITLRLALEASYRVITITTAVQILRFRWGRWEIGPWLMCLSLLWVHMDGDPMIAQSPPGSGLVAVLLFGMSMLLIVFDDYKMRHRRLGVINTLTTAITRAQQHEPVMITALEELKSLMDAKAAYFRMVEGDRLVISQQIGLSKEFLRDRSSVAIDDQVESILREGKPAEINVAQAKIVRPQWNKEGFRYVVMVPVSGKKSVIGTLVLGSRRRLSYTPADMEFLGTTGRQLGLALENLRLVEQILRSHRQWTNTFDSIQDLVLVHDAEFRIMKANRALLQLLEQAPADVVGSTCEAVLPKTTAWAGCPYCSQSEESLHEGADPCFGGYAVVSSSSYAEHGSKQKGTIHVVRDTSDRRLAEEKYRLLFEQVQEGVFVATPQGKLLDCNDAFVRMLGYEREQLMSLNVDKELYTSPDQRNAFRREVEAHNYVRDFEVTLRRADGSLLTAVESSFATRNANGEIERYQGFLLDITEKKRAENEIRRRNRELNALNAMAVIATQSFDLDEILNLTLRQVISLLGVETGAIYLCEGGDAVFRRRASWGPRNADRLRHAEVSFPEGFGDLITRSRTEVITAEYLPHLPKSVTEFISADGMRSWIWVLLWGKDNPIGIMGISSSHAREYNSNEENLLVAIGRQLATTIEKVRLYEETCRAYEDLTRTQEQLLQSEKMSAVGQLIAGVAHELNNPLTAILGYAQLLESEGLSERAADFVAKLFKQAQRTHRVVQNLLSFARQRKTQKAEIDICKVLDETLTLRDYDLKVHNIRLVREIEQPLPAVTGDAHQLEQVFLNIINNAVDAMLEAGSGGTLKVRVYFEDDFVHAEFQDSGKGIKDTHRVFEPFYTTKSIGKGTGLGLSICYGIIKEHGGDISARNAQEGGAIIEICLPSAGQTVSVQAALPVPQRELAIEGRILLVEDEEAVLEFERDVLSGAGASVVTSTGAEEAKVQMLAQPFDAVIINGKMPGEWNAPEAYQWVAKACPGSERRVLFTFSSDVEPDVRSFLAANDIPCLVKPFEVGDFLSHARRLLQKSLAAAAG
ncbi:MAG: PAS domain S-box protein [Acidobacteriales bacterium]|nr:PAS domain S-box protein [Terriglobales bacterium]